MREPIERGERAIRNAWRMEIRPEELSTVIRILDGLPQPAEEIDAVTLLAAAGQDLIHQKQFAQRTLQMIRDGELVMESPAEWSVLEEVHRGLQEMVRLLEGHLGAFPEPETPWGRSGVRETYLVDVAPDHRKGAEWLVELARQVDDVPLPPEPYGRMRLRALGEDLREVCRVLTGLSTGVLEDDLRELLVEVERRSREMAESVFAVLPPLPGEPPSAAMPRPSAGEGD